MRRGNCAGSVLLIIHWMVLRSLTVVLQDDSRLVDLAYKHNVITA